jgi:multidrug efflux pump subunit AcrA (membrane-fusion protein)
MICLFLVLLTVAGTWVWKTEANLIIKTHGRIRPTTHPTRVFNSASGERFGAALGGRVVKVNYRQGDIVRKGDVLIQLDTEQLEAEIAKQQQMIQNDEALLERKDSLGRHLLQQYKAARATAEAVLNHAIERVARARIRRDNEIDIARPQLASAEDHERRIRALRKQRNSTAEEYVKAQTAVKEAQAKLEIAREPVDEQLVQIARRALEMEDSNFLVKREELIFSQEMIQGRVRAAKGDLKVLELTQRHATIVAPVSGIVTSVELKEGDVVESGQPVVFIAESESLCMEVSVSAEDVGHLRVNMPARIKLDAYDYQKYGTVPGTVLFVSPDSETSAGSAIKHGAFYTARLRLDQKEIRRGQLHGQIKLGMTGQAEIITDRESILSILLRGVRRTISLD